MCVVHIVGTQENICPMLDEGKALSPSAERQLDCGGLFKVTLGQWGSKPGLLMPEASTTSATQNKQLFVEGHPLPELIGKPEPLKTLAVLCLHLGCAPRPSGQLHNTPPPSFSPLS